MSCHTSRRQRSGLLCWLSLLFCLFLGALPASSSERTISPEELTPFILNLKRAGAMLEKLEIDLRTQSVEAGILSERLQKAYEEVEKLKSELAGLRASLTSSEQQRQALETDLSAASSLLGKLVERYSTLSKDFSAYKSAMELALRKATCGRNAWMVIAFLGIIGSGVGAVAWAAGR